MRPYQVLNPANGESGVAFKQISNEDLREAVQMADRAYRAWGRRTTIPQRAEALHRVAQLHRQQRLALADIVVREVGKPVRQARGEIDFSADIYDYYADNAEEFLRDEHIDVVAIPGAALVRKEPLGVLLGIMPWNFPFYQVARFAAPNLLLGNSLMLKHAPQCPASSAAIERILAEAGFPVGAYTNIYASNDQIADLIADPRIQGVSLTGSERAGSAVAEIAGRNLKKVVLELGGADAFLVLSADDLDEVVAFAVSSRLENSGQTCNAAKRFVVVGELYDEFVRRMAEALSEAVPGDPTRSDTLLGPVSSTEAAERLQQQLEVAVAHGARIVEGGRPEGNFFPGTLLVDVRPGNPAYDEEFFGPVAVVHRVENEDEAIEVANDNPFGLGSYLFTDDAEQASRVAGQLEVGMVFINGAGVESPELPFGGIKRSGFGRELGRFSVDEFANRKLIRTVR